MLPVPAQHRRDKSCPQGGSPWDRGTVRTRTAENHPRQDQGFIYTSRKNSHPESCEEGKKANKTQSEAVICLPNTNPCTLSALGPPHPPLQRETKGMIRVQLPAPHLKKTPSESTTRLPRGVCPCPGGVEQPWLPAGGAASIFIQSVCPGHRQPPFLQRLHLQLL